MKLKILNEGLLGIVGNIGSFITLWKDHKNDVQQYFRDRHGLYGNDITLGRQPGQVYRDGYRILELGARKLPVNQLEVEKLTGCLTQREFKNTMNDILDRRNINPYIKSDIVEFLNNPSTNIPIGSKAGEKFTDGNHLDLNVEVTKRIESGQLLKDVGKEVALDVIGGFGIPLNVVDDAEDWYDAFAAPFKREHKVLIRNPIDDNEIRNVKTYANHAMRDVNAQQTDPSKPSYRLAGDSYSWSSGIGSYLNSSPGSGGGGSSDLSLLDDLYKRYPSLKTTLGWFGESPMNLSIGIMGTLLAGYGLYKAAKAVKAFFKNRKKEADELMKSEHFPQSKEEGSL